MAHRVSCPLRARVKGSTCTFCGTDFRARVRLRTHLLSGAAACVAQASSLPLLSPAEEVAENEREREEARGARRRGNHPLDGPPARSFCLICAVTYVRALACVELLALLPTVLVSIRSE